MSEQSDDVLYRNQLELQKQLDDQLVLIKQQEELIEQLRKQQFKRTVPSSDLDLNLMLTDTVWSNLPPGLKEKLTKYYVTVVKGPDGKDQRMMTKEDMSAILGFYTRDLRLGNLSAFGGEINFCEYHLDLANDFLKEGFVDPFLVCLSRVATKLELSQSKGGFLRKRNSSFTNETVTKSEEPPKRTILGNKKVE